MVDPLTDGQITHLLSLLSGGRKRPFAGEMLAGIQSSHPQLTVKRHPHTDSDEVHVRTLKHFVRSRQKREELRNAWPFRLRFPVGSC
jgi:hypothetical protein